MTSFKGSKNFFLEMRIFFHFSWLFNCHEFSVCQLYTHLWLDLNLFLFMLDSYSCHGRKWKAIKNEKKKNIHLLSLFQHWYSFSFATTAAFCRRRLFFDIDNRIRSREMKNWYLLLQYRPSKWHSSLLVRRFGGRNRKRWIKSNPRLIFSYSKFWNNFFIVEWNLNLRSKSCVGFQWTLKYQFLFIFLKKL